MLGIKVLTFKFKFRQVPLTLPIILVMSFNLLLSEQIGQAVLDDLLKILASVKI